MVGASEGKRVASLVELSQTLSKIDKVPTPNKKRLCDIFDDVEKGRIAIPDFQRGWTWWRYQIEELWESIFRGYYVGSILTWKPSKYEFATNPVVGGPQLKDNEPPVLILDGQQRITAIYYAVKGPPRNIPGTKSECRFYLNINALLDPARDSSEVVESYYMDDKRRPADDKAEFRLKKFPLTSMNKYDNWMWGFHDYLTDEERMDKNNCKRYIDVLRNTLGSVWSTYEIPEIVLSPDLELDNVATVFERINSKGTVLGVFELLNARLRVHATSLNALWEGTKSEYQTVREWSEKKDGVPLYILQSMMLSKTGQTSRKALLKIDEAFEDASGRFDAEIFEGEWRRTSERIDGALRMITSTDGDGLGAITPDMIPFGTMVPMLAALLEVAKSDLGAQAERMAKIRYWYWTCVVRDRYSRSVLSAMEADYKAVMEWLRGGKGFRLDDEPNFKASPRSAVYKAVMCAIALKGASDFITDQAPKRTELEDHHIFPKAKEKKFVKSGSNFDIDMVLNRTLITPPTNRYISDKDPSQYIKCMKLEGDEDRAVDKLKTHLISPEAFECMKGGDFEGFATEREKTIREEFARLQEDSLQGAGM